jgi:Fic family protein
MLNNSLLEAYRQKVSATSLETYEQLNDSELSIATFSFYTSVAAVFSSKIEGENIQIDSYIKYKRFGIDFLPDYTRKIDDLYEAYLFAQQHDLCENNILKVHKLLTRNILASHRQGEIRYSNMYVTTDDGRIEYVAASPFIVKNELARFFEALDMLLQKKLDIQEVFYYAALIHLFFVKIHPFDDGNGRTSRLIEKWFLASKLGKKGWLINSEKNYYQQHQTYYQNIRKLGLEYDHLDYEQALPFLCMLPQALRNLGA